MACRQLLDAGETFARCSPEPRIAGFAGRPATMVRLPAMTSPLSGVSAMSLYVPPFRVKLQDWCDWTGNSWEKISAVVGHSFRVPGRHENVYTMAANAVLRLIRQNDIDPARVGFLGLG